MRQALEASRLLPKSVHVLANGCMLEPLQTEAMLAPNLHAGLSMLVGYADGDFVSNWTVVQGTRRPRPQTSSYYSYYTGSDNIIASIAATCRSGIQLEAVSVPALSANWTISYWDPILFDSDEDASKSQNGWYYYGSYAGGQDLKAANPYGFRAVWLPYALNLKNF